LFLIFTSLYLIFLCFNFVLQSSISFLAWETSEIVLTIGIIIDIFPKTEARKIALSCFLNQCGFFREYRIPLFPKNGFSSLSFVSNLSPPKSKVRIVTGKFCISAAIFL
jgi:hypothetical protein